MDSTSAIQQTINDAQSQGKSVWIPQGRFIVTGAGLTATGVTIEGAGMWYSTIYRNLTLPASTTLPTMWQVTSVTLKNFLIDSNSTSRNNADGDFGGITMYGTNWLVDSMWVQHCSSGVWGAGTGGTAQNNRMLSDWGDGININNSNNGGTGNNLTVGEQLRARRRRRRGHHQLRLQLRADAELNAQEQHDRVHLLGAGLGVYGGINDVVEDNLLCDPANFPGMLVSIFNGAPLQSGTVQGNVVVRGGGDCYNQNQAAIEIGSRPRAATVESVQFSNNVIIDSMQKAVELTNSSSITFANNVIDGLWVNSASPSSSSARSTSIRPDRVGHLHVEHAAGPSGRAGRLGQLVGERIPDERHGQRGLRPYRGRSHDLDGQLGRRRRQADGVLHDAGLPHPRRRRLS